MLGNKPLLAVSLVELTDHFLSWGNTIPLVVLTVDHPDKLVYQHNPSLGTYLRMIMDAFTCWKVDLQCWPIYTCGDLHLYSLGLLHLWLILCIKSPFAQWQVCPHDS
jgi:hypothetical protein